ncbi:MAG: TIGR02466 family protein [Gammaproteobacteria bacterium]
MDHPPPSAFPTGQPADQPRNDDPASLAQLGLDSMAKGDLPGAEARLRECLSMQPENTNALVNLGAVLQQRGHIHAAINCYRKVLATENDPAVRCNLAKALSDAGEFENALLECESSDNSIILATRGAILLDMEHYPEARDTLQEAVGISADDMSLVNLALTRYQTGDIHGAISDLQQALEINPYNARAVADLANAFCANGDAGSAIDMCESFLQQIPGERLVIGSYALALHNAGRTEQALYLTDCDKLVHIFECDNPKAFANTRTMNDMLTAELKKNPSRLQNPIGKATSGGEQTGELNLSRSIALQSLQNFIQECVGEAANALLDAGLEDHPVMALARETQSLRAWGTLLPQHGQQSPHMHPLGWLSGVYYTHLPKDMNTSEAEAGWLAFNTPPERFYTREATREWRYEPAEGRLILFPSWFWHQTLPFESSDDRISIAFDIVPTRLLRML